MGYKYEVHEWYEDRTTGKGYAYHLQHQTQWLIVALFYMWRLKKNGAYCLKIEWRR